MCACHCIKGQRAVANPKPINRKAFPSRVQCYYSFETGKDATSLQHTGHCWGNTFIKFLIGFGLWMAQFLPKSNNNNPWQNSPFMNLGSRGFQSTSFGDGKDTVAVCVVAIALDWDYHPDLTQILIVPSWVNWHPISTQLQNSLCCQWDLDRGLLFWRSSSMCNIRMSRSQQTTL